MKIKCNCTVSNKILEKRGKWGNLKMKVKSGKPDTQFKFKRQIISQSDMDNVAQRSRVNGNGIFYFISPE